MLKTWRTDNQIMLVMFFRKKEKKCNKKEKFDQLDKQSYIEKIISLK